MKTVIIIQARMSSTRLPGKVLKLVMGRPLLEYQLERLRNVANADEIVVATTINPLDDAIVDVCQRLEVSCYRGSENDVLQRYIGAALQTRAKCVVRINSDCPLIDPTIVEHLINVFHHDSENLDYVSNILEPGYPIGFHTEVFSLKAITRANQLSNSSEEREHVTPYIYRNPNNFSLKSVTIRPDLSQFRLTIDYPEDFKLVEKIIEALYPQNPGFKMQDIIDFLVANPKLRFLNNSFTKQQTI